MTNETPDERTDRLEERERFFSGMRAVLDFFHANPDLPTPGRGSASVAMFVTKEQAERIVRSGGKFTKEFIGNTLYLRPAALPDSVCYLVNRAEVCERIVVGTKEVPEKVIPAHVEEIVEWECKPLLGGDDA